MSSEIQERVENKVNEWLSAAIDPAFKKEIEQLQKENPNELTECFYQDLAFGTGGLRGLMGVGTNRMNKYTVGMATQGFANYLKAQFDGSIKVAIAHDSRNNSDVFTRVAAEVFSANGIEVYVFDSLRPTPLLSYTIRHLNCQGGVVVTASHNPKEYNGYKVYWNDGAQVVAPHDKNIMDAVNSIASLEDIKMNGNETLIHKLGSEIDEAYLKELKGLSLNPEIIQKQKDLKIIFTPIHGSGVTLVPPGLKALGFENVEVLEAQKEPDGNFPTVVYPNPEEAEALSMAIDRAKAMKADLILATDPDADRVGIAVKDKEGKYVLMNGNETATIFVYYLLSQWKANNKLKGKEYIVKTIVTTNLLAEIADHFSVPCYNVLTGFKYIAEVMGEQEGKATFIGGGEESYGLLAGEFVRDKDAVIASCLIAEVAAWAANEGKTLYTLLEEIHREQNFYRESLLSITKKGMNGAAEIKAMMENFRSNPPQKLAGKAVRYAYDYQLSEKTRLEDSEKTQILLPKSNVIQFELEDGSLITARPSGTEPKIKFYFSVRDRLDANTDYGQAKKQADEKIKAIQSDLGL